MVKTYSKLLNTEKTDLWKIGHRKFGHKGLFDSYNMAVY